MKNRTVLLVVAAVVLLALCVAAGVQAGLFLERRRCNEKELAAAETHRQETGKLRREALIWADALATHEAQAVLRSFVSGIGPAVRTGRRESLEMSAVSLLRVAGVEGIHILQPDGIVVYSSDAKLATTGKGGERAAWALSVTDLASRPSFRPGVLEVAAPVVDAGQTLAVVWLEFGHARVRDAARPPKLAADLLPGTTKDDASPEGEKPAER